MPPDILFEDNHLLVVVKPPNIPCQEDASGDPDLLSILKAGIKERHKKPGNVFLGLVHRLDRPTGGVMVFARTSKAASRLSDQVRRQAMRKHYLAVVIGSPNPAAGEMTDYLVKDRENNIVSPCSENTEGGRYAELSYETVCTTDQSSLLKIKLKTGRSHQIRVQCASRGHALLGDQRYNRNAIAGTQLALWASELAFEHPTQNDTMVFTSTPPDQPPWSNFS